MAENKEIIAALLKAQAEMGNPTKGTNNPFYKSKYADLNAVREAVIPVLNKCGIVVMQPVVSIEGRNYVRTLLLHESGENLMSDVEILYSKQNDAQAQGSGITYARRYGLQSLVCIGADDDDGNKASGVDEKNKPQKSTQPQEPTSVIFDMIEKADNVDTLKEIWEAYPQYQRNQKFKNSINNAKSKFELQSAS